MCGKGSLLHSSCIILFHNGIFGKEVPLLHVSIETQIVFQKEQCFLVGWANSNLSFYLLRSNITKSRLSWKSVFPILKKKSAECPLYKQLFYNIVYYLIYLKTYSFNEAIWFPVTFYKLLLFLHSCFWEQPVVSLPHSLLVKGRSSSFH